MLRTLKTALIIVGLSVLALVGWILFSINDGGTSSTIYWALAVLNIIMLGLVVRILVIQREARRNGTA